MPDRSRVYTHLLRNRVLAEFQRGPTAPSDVARRLGISLNLVSYHTHVLRRHGYLELVDTERRRGARTRRYRAAMTPIIDDDAWQALGVTQRRDLALSALEQIAMEAREAVRAGAFEIEQAHLSRSPVELDFEGRAAVGVVLRDAFERVTRIAAAAASSREDGGRSHRVAMLAFELRSELSPSAARSDPSRR